MKRVWKLLPTGVLLAAMLFVSACSGGNNDPASGAPVEENAASTNTASTDAGGANADAAADDAAPEVLKGDIKLVMWHQPTIDAVNAEIATYKQLHPDVNIEIIFSAFDQYYTTIQTQLIGGGAPAGVGVSPETTQMLAKYLEPLTPYFEQENPYTGQPWKQDFVEEAYEIGKSGTEDAWMVGVAGAVNTGVWYNKKILDEVGVAVPTTWEELMEAQKKVKAAGKIAWSEQLVANFKGDWYNWQLNYGYNLDNWMKLDTLVKDGRVSQMEVVRGIKKGEIDLKGPEVRGMFTEWKKWVDAGWPENFSSDWGWYDAFVSGKAAFFLGGSWDTPSFTANIKDFEYGHFSLPNPSDPSDPIDMANLGGSWALNKSAKPEEKAIFIDFMRYLSQPDVHKRVVEAQGMLPVVEGVTLTDPVMAEWAEDARFNVSKIQAISLDNELASKFLGYSQEYLTGGSLEGFVDKYAEIYAEAADRLITQNKWDTSGW